MWPFKKQKIDKNFFVASQEKVKYTPDYCALQDRFNIPVFIYNECMQDHGMYNLLLHDCFYAVGFTAQPRYRLWYDRSRGTVVMIEERYIAPGVSPSAPARVKGELYFVKPQTVVELDKFHENGNKFFRKDIRILLPTFDRSAKVLKMQLRDCIQPAFTYVGNPDYWNISDYSHRPVSKHIPRDEFKPIGDYFFFSLHEFDK